MAADPSIAAEAEAAARRSEEAAESFFRAAPPLRDRDRVAASVANFVVRRSAGKWAPQSLTSPLALMISSLRLVYSGRSPVRLNLDFDWPLLTVQAGLPEAPG